MNSGAFLTPVNSDVKKCTRVHGPSTRIVETRLKNEKLVSLKYVKLVHFVFPIKLDTDIYIYIYLHAGSILIMHTCSYTFTYYNYAATKHKKHSAAATGSITDKLLTISH